MAQFEFNGNNLEYNFMDADQMEVYENAMTALNESFNKCDVSQFSTRSGELKWCCRTIKEELKKCFPNIEEILPGNDYGKCMEFVATLTKVSLEAQKDVQRNIREISGNAVSAAGGGNRATRRANKKRRH